MIDNESCNKEEAILKVNKSGKRRKFKTKLIIGGVSTFLLITALLILFNSNWLKSNEASLIVNKNVQFPKNRVLEYVRLMSNCMVFNSKNESKVKINGKDKSSCTLEKAVFHLYPRNISSKKYNEIDIIVKEFNKINVKETENKTIEDYSINDLDEHNVTDINIPFVFKVLINKEGKFISMKSLKHLPKENKMLIKGFLAQLTPKLKKDLYFKKDSDLSKSIKADEEEYHMEEGPQGLVLPKRYIEKEDQKEITIAKEFSKYHYLPEARESFSENSHMHYHEISTLDKNSGLLKHSTLREGFYFNSPEHHAVDLDVGVRIKSKVWLHEERNIEDWEQELLDENTLKNKNHNRILQTDENLKLPKILEEEWSFSLNGERRNLAENSTEAENTTADPTSTEASFKTYLGESPYKIKLDNVGKKTIFDLRYEMKLEMNLFEANLVQLTSEEKKNGPSDITINEMNNILSNPVNKSLNCSRPSLNFQRKTFGMEVKMSIAVKRPGKCERRFTLFQTEFKLDNFFANLMKNAEAFKDEALDFFKEATDKNISDILDKLDKQNISHKIKINNCLNLLLAKVCFTGDLHINGNLNFSTIPKDFLQKNSQAIHKFFQRVSLSKRDFKKVTIPRPTNVLCSNLGEKLNLIYVPKLDCQIKKRIVRYDNKRTCRKIVFWTKCSNKQVPVYGDYYFCYTDSGTKTYTLATGNKQKEIRDKIVKKNEMIKKLANNAQGILDTYERDVKKALDIMQPLDVKNILSDMDLNVIIDFSGNLDFGGNITMMVDIAWTDDLDFGVRTEMSLLEPVFRESRIGFNMGKLLEVINNQISTKFNSIQMNEFLQTISVKLDFELKVLNMSGYIIGQRSLIEKSKNLIDKIYGVYKKALAQVDKITGGNRRMLGIFGDVKSFFDNTAKTLEKVGGDAKTFFDKAGNEIKNKGENVIKKVDDFVDKNIPKEPFTKALDFVKSKLEEEFGEVICNLITEDVSDKPKKSRYGGIGETIETKLYDLDLDDYHCTTNNVTLLDLTAKAKTNLKCTEIRRPGITSPIGK